MTKKLCNSCEYLRYCARSGIEDVGCDRYKRDTTTNEEFLRSSTFDELAGAIYEWYSQGHIEGKFGKQLSSATRVVEWLREIHNDM